MSYLSTPTAKKYIEAENLLENEIQWVEHYNLMPEGQQTGLDAASTGVKYTGLSQIYLDPQMLRHLKAAYLEYAVINITSGAGVKIHLYNVTDAGNTASTAEITADTARSRLTIPVDTLTAEMGDEVTVRAECTTAITGGTFDLVMARLVLIKGVS